MDYINKLPEFGVINSFLSVLVSYQLIFIAAAPIWAIRKTSLHKPHHFILIKVDFAKIAFPIFVIGIVRTGFATGFGFFHLISPFIS